MCWRSGLTHYPLKVAFMGSNPIHITKLKRFIVGVVDNYVLYTKDSMILTIVLSILSVIESILRGRTSLISTS